MIVVMNRKFFEKKVAKLAAPSPYIVVDAENYSVTGSTSDEVAIATRYSNTVSIGSYTPEGRLYSMLKKLKRGDEVDPRKFDAEVDYFLEDRSFISGVIKTFRGLYSCGFNEHLNIFVVLPNIVYKYLSEQIIETMVKMLDLEYRIIFSQEELKSFGYDKLEIPIKKSLLREVAARVERLEKKHKIKYKERDDWDDDD